MIEMQKTVKDDFDAAVGKSIAKQILTRAELADKAAKELREKDDLYDLPRWYRRKEKKRILAWKKKLEELVIEYITKTTVEGMDPESEEGLTVLDQLDKRWRDYIRPGVQKIIRMDIGVYDTSDKREKVYGRFLDFIGGFHKQLEKERKEDAAKINDLEIEYEDAGEDKPIKPNIIKSGRTKSKKDITIPDPHTQTVGFLLSEGRPFEIKEIHSLLGGYGIVTKARTEKGLTKAIESKAMPKELEDIKRDLVEMLF